MRIATVLIAAAATIVSTGLAVSHCFAQEPAAADQPYQVLRPGDRDMSCEQLASEANSLNAVILSQQKSRDSGASHKVAGAVGGGLLKSAGRFGLGRIGGFGGLVARAAADQAANSAGEAIANGGDSSANAAPTVTPEQQRMNHLLGLYKEKGC